MNVRFGCAVSSSNLISNDHDVVIVSEPGKEVGVKERYGWMILKMLK
jgi:hypothetical protein